MFQRIIVPFDDSQGSQLARDLACGLALSSGAKVRLVHHLDVRAFPNAHGLGEPVIRLAREAAGTMLAGACERLAKQGVDAETRLCAEPGASLAQCVREEAIAWKADGIVLGSHGRRGLAHALLGSGAEHIVRQAPVPALVVRKRPDHRFKHILVAVDGSETSLHALTKALQLARDTGAEIRLLHCLTEMALLGAYAATHVVVDELRAGAAETLRLAADIAASAGLRAQTALSDREVGLGQAVAREAVHWGADLVVTGTHGRRGVSHALLGSGAEQILRESPVSVLVVPGLPATHATP